MVRRRVSRSLISPQPYQELEQRRLLACDLGGPATVLATEGNDLIHVEVTWENIRVFVNNDVTNFDPDTTDRIVIHGLGGEDNFSFQEFTGSDNDAELCPYNVHIENRLVDIYAYGVENTHIDGAGSNGTAIITDSEMNELVTSSGRSTYLEGVDFTARVNGYREVYVNSIGGYDQAFFNGTSSEETMISVPHSTRFNYLAWSSFVAVNDFELVQGISNGGNDLLALNGSEATSDGLYARPDLTRLYIADTNAIVRGVGFERVVADGRGGSDHVDFIDSAGDDTFYFRPGFANLTTSDVVINASNFENVFVFGHNGGLDTASILDSPGDERFHAGPNGVTLVGPGFIVGIQKFEIVDMFASAGNDFAATSNFAGEQFVFGSPEYVFVASGGLRVKMSRFDRYSVTGNLADNDRAIMLDSPGNDEFFGTLKGQGSSLESVAILRNNNYFISLLNVPTVKVSTVGGTDSAYLSSSSSNGLFDANPEESLIYSDPGDDQIEIRAIGFSRVIGTFSNPNPNLQNKATLAGSANADDFYATRHLGVLSGTTFLGDNYSVIINGADSLEVDGKLGNDVANLRGTADDETLTLRPGYGLLSSPLGVTPRKYDISVVDFSRIVATGGGGFNHIGMTDSQGDDTFFVNATRAYIRGDGFHIQGNGFVSVNASATNGFDKAFMYDSLGDDSFEAINNIATLRSPGLAVSKRARAFDEVHAVSINGGFDELTVGEIDFQLFQIGNWN